MGKQKKEKEKRSIAPSLTVDDFPSLGCGSGSGISSGCDKSADGKSSVAPHLSASHPTSSPDASIACSESTASTATLLAPSAWLKTSAVATSGVPCSLAARLPQQTESPDTRTEQAVIECDWMVAATKTAKLPIQIEKRKHKTVTVVRNITGNAAALLSSLKVALGTGGTLVQGGGDTDVSGGVEIEIQGDHAKRIGAYLTGEHARLVQSGGRGALRGVSKGELEEHSRSGADKKGKGNAPAGAGRSIASLDKKAAVLKQQAR